MVVIANDYLIEAWRKRTWSEREATRFVYTITCTENGKVYVGITREPMDRARNHRSQLRCGTHQNKNLQIDYQKYGGDSFVFEIVQKTTSIRAIRDKVEEKNIRKYKSYDPKYGYNDCPYSKMMREISSIYNK